MYMYMYLSHYSTNIMCSVYNYNTVETGLLAHALVGSIAELYGYHSVLSVTAHLPPVTIKGSRDHLHVYYQVPRQMCDELPEKFRSESGIQIIPVLFNKGVITFIH